MQNALNYIMAVSNMQFYNRNLRNKRVHLKLHLGNCFITNYRFVYNTFSVSGFEYLDI